MSIYKNDISKHINNNKNYCYLDNINHNNFDYLFDDISSIYKDKYLIRTIKKEYITNLIGKTDKYLITFNDEKVPINEIISIEKYSEKNI